MRKPLRTEDEAIAELRDAIVWYEERRVGLGAEFFAAVEATLDQIARLPQAGAPLARVPAELAVRRAPVKRFPYQVVYLETSEAIRILAFAHDTGITAHAIIDATNLNERLTAGQLRIVSLFVPFAR